MHIILGLISNWRALLTLAMVSLGSYGYLKHRALQNDLVVERQNVSELEKALEVQRATTAATLDTVEMWKRAQEQLVQKINEMQAAERKARSEARRLNELYKKHDLAKLATAKAGLVQRRLNDGTARVQRLLECASGASRCSADSPGVPGPEAPSTTP